MFLFLPLTLVLFYVIGGRGYTQTALTWLVGMSFVFYGWWNPAYLGLMLISIVFNFSFGAMLSSQATLVPKKVLMAIGVIINLAILGYFKYANFFVENFNFVQTLPPK